MSTLSNRKLNGKNANITSAPYPLETVKQQIKLLTPAELRHLQNEINHSLNTKNPELLSNEERELIASLF